MCNLAWAYRRQGDHRGGAEVLHQVVESQFADSWAIYSLACELALAGESAVSGAHSTGAVGGAGVGSRGAVGGITTNRRLHSSAR